MCGAQSDKKMHMIGHTADAFRDPIVSPGDSAEICVQFRTPLPFNYRVVIFGSENQMIMQTQMG